MFRKVAHSLFQQSFRLNHIHPQSRLVHFVKPNLLTMKLDTPEFQSLFTPELEQLISLFKKYEFELRIAGGAVRDILRGISPHDVDFATTATPDEMKELFNKEGIRMINNKGEKHGTITCRINDKENFEVTTLRIDVVTDGRHAEVQFTTDWQLDAMRRDLTVNSMFLAFDGTLYDYYSGKEDLKQKKIRFVGDAVARIQEDYLRILRYFRFYGRIAIEPDAHEDATLQAIRDNMSGLAGISGERLWVEVKKILPGNHAPSIITTMLDLGMAQYIGFPERCNTEMFRAVYDRSISLQPSHMTLLTALLQNEDQVYTIHKRLKLSNDELRTALFIVKHRDDDLGEDSFKYCQDLMIDTVGKEPKNRDRITELIKYLGNEDLLKQFSAWVPKKFPVSGHKLLEAGVEKGPKLAKMLDRLRTVWKESRFSLDEEGLMEHVEDLKKQMK